MKTLSQPEPWLRGPVPGIPAPLQPAAHAFLAALEDVEPAISDLSADQLWVNVAQTNPVSSRAMAVTTCCLGLPRAASR